MEDAPRRTLKLPLVALTATAAAVLVDLRRAPRETHPPRAPEGAGLIRSEASDEGEALLTKQFRDVVRARQLVPDYRSDRGAR